MTIAAVRHLRRASQALFFAAFFWLILKTTFEADFRATGGGEIRLPYPVSIGLELDPLVGLANLLANGTVYSGLLLGLVVLLPTIFFGRFFCGWVCPLGSLNHWLSEVRSERAANRGARKIEANRYRGYQRIKYYLLLVFLGAALAGVLQIGLLDPIALLARSLGTVVLPALHVAAEGVRDAVAAVGFAPLTNAAQRVYDTLGPLVLPFRPQFFHALLTIGALFVAILWLNRLFTRFWCRGICPLGALLGLFSRLAVFGLEKNAASCDHCNKCLLHCQGADNPDVGSAWRQEECVLCLNCQAACPHGSLRFRFFPRLEGTRDNPAPVRTPHLTRRKVLGSLAGGLALFPLFRAGDAFSANPNPLLIRPPGAPPEDDFLARCIRCGQCMRVCPNNALHPTLLESGFEGLWTPVLIPRIGYCEPSCTLCGQVCPTGAIEELTLSEKVGDRATPGVHIGTAFVDRGRCLPWAMAIPCIVCEEWCPVSPKAIYLREEIAYDRNGDAVNVKRPFVDPAICNGCGACEFACPVADQAAIRVSSVGESRSRENRILLDRRPARREPSGPRAN
ncbi:MAG TPA: 4Fe-4S binding protein [candidate division Zixibacteria bacterium]|nr:4Fe-4S binding protein [candidate division Zixibacteria bacterium]MDD4916674.1 4Fe-4S binding protein [candidate division Zixibacteria bacterium]MDM7973232.1 4Fe-4S binding protein [candidate division Zixibacteria bacterium]HOD66024.1 4Fe-4S binding protein [candidate division Zixibacteria bacterium]HOZ06832.1 4Fe-4S binding protein [candidate division Zixibacteria bacterium]